MVSLLAVIGVGFVLGTRHATDPDHVVAVSTIVSRQRSISHAGVIGILWGIGHTITICAAGIAIILFKLAIPPRIGLTMELAVGVMLILLGLLNLTGITHWMTNRYTPHQQHRGTIRSHFHEHGGGVHQHGHGQQPEVQLHLEQPPKRALQSMLKRMGLYQSLRPLAVGIVHGLAGSAAVALLVLAEIQDPRWAIAYLLVFGLGTIAGMMLITMLIGAPFAYTGRRFATFHRGLGIASGVLSVAFGLFITFQITVTNGLFATHPHWTPR